MKAQISQKYIHAINKIPSLAAVLLSLASALGRKNCILYGCGGSIRDIALSIQQDSNCTIKDFDFVIEGVNDPDSFSGFLHNFSSNHERIESINYVGQSFPVWKLKITGLSEPIDVALARAEKSFGNHHRDFQIVTENVTIQEDSLRRDFTFNAMFITLSHDPEHGLQGELLDHHNGLEDIQDRVVRTVGLPEDRFGEDPLRMLRAVRFCTVLPDFHLETETASSIQGLAPDLIPTISPARFAEELYRALKEAPRKTLSLLGSLGITDILLPEFALLPEKTCLKTANRIHLLTDAIPHDTPSYLIFAALLMDIASAHSAQKIVSELSTSKIPPGFFQVTEIDNIARRLCLADIKLIVQLCYHTLLLENLSLLEFPDATLEHIFSTTSTPEYLHLFYQAHVQALDMEPEDLQARLAGIPSPVILFNSVLQKTGLPTGPYLQPIKLTLRQKEIDGEIITEQSAVDLVLRFYSKEKNSIDSHINRLNCFFQKHDKSEPLPENLLYESNKLLFTRPVLLLNAYREHELLPILFPELSEAEEKVEMTSHHFSSSFLNDTLLSLSLLYNEEPNPTPVQILATLFLDIGMGRCLGRKADGTPTYYKHDVIGAEMTREICHRMQLDETTVDEVVFIIRNHNTLILSGAEKRFDKLLDTENLPILFDLLLIHKVDQMAKMRIVNGHRIEEGKLDTYYTLSGSLLHNYQQKQRKRQNQIKNKQFTPFLNGTDLQQSNSYWGPGITKGPELGKILNFLHRSQKKKKMNNRKEALRAARGKIILHHLTHNPVHYLEELRKNKLLSEILPEIGALIGLEQKSPHHQEDAYTHTLNVINALPEDAHPELKLAAIFHDTGKPAARTYDEKKVPIIFMVMKKKALKSLTPAAQD